MRVCLYAQSVMVLNLKEKRTVMNPSIMGDVSHLFLLRTFVELLLSLTVVCTYSVTSYNQTAHWAVPHLHRMGLELCESYLAETTYNKLRQNLADS